MCFINSIACESSIVILIHLLTMEELNSETMIHFLSILINTNTVRENSISNINHSLSVFHTCALYAIFFVWCNSMPSIACESSARLFNMYIINFLNIIIMDDVRELILDGLLDRYIEENAKFHVNQVVYMEYNYKYHNQTRLGVCVGIVNYVGCTKVQRTVGNQTYVDYPITYTVVHAKGVTYNVSECKLGSVTEHILKERIRRSSKDNEHIANTVDDLPND